MWFAADTGAAIPGTSSRVSMTAARNNPVRNIIAPMDRTRFIKSRNRAEPRT